MDDHASHDLAALEGAFSDEEWKALRMEDMKAGTAVVCLMLAIFLTGVVLYSIVAITF
ncbi:MAG: hypothetical protein L0Y72_11225 [Gemmataceae bacterium]|nr:hypothetical protein [Gemmataceae bacterium]MCI0739608.1 hypothetical protein [Gemmataceae bacterium]